MGAVCRAVFAGGCHDAPHDGAYAGNRKDSARDRVGSVTRVAEERSSGAKVMRDGIDDFRQQIQEPAGRKKRAPGWQMPLELAARFDTASFTVDAPKRRLQQRPVCRAENETSARVG